MKELCRKRIMSAEDNVLVDYDREALGATFRDAAREALADADTFVVIWSPAAAASRWVNYEVGMADALGKEVIVVLLKGASPHLPASLQQAHSIELQYG